MERTSEAVISWTLPTCFNSLQTGKFMEREAYRNWQHDAIEFQFPSNGKVHGKPVITELLKHFDVSFNSLQTGKFMESYNMLKGINPKYPFQFPSNGKVHGKMWTHPLKAAALLICFNSLQTGKFMESVKQVSIIRVIRFCFNSLQTGKFMESRCL